MEQSIYYITVMDPLHIIQVSILSKFLSEPSNLLMNPWILTFIFLYASMKLVPCQIYDYLENEIKEWYLSENEVSCIMIPYHLKNYTSYGTSKTIDKVLYSDRFRAINYHIKKYHLHKLFSLTEIINFENSRYLEGDCDFILLPKDTTFKSLAGCLYTSFPSLYVRTFSPNKRNVAVNIVSPAPPEPAVKKSNFTSSTLSCPFAYFSINS